MEISGLYFGMRLVTLCRVLVVMFVDVHERIIVVFFLKTECIMEGRSKVEENISKMFRRSVKGEGSDEGAKPIHFM